MQRHYTFLDKICLQVDQALRTLVPQSHSQKIFPQRVNPAANLPESELTLSEQRYAGALMRVNHVGEVCAQALYRGQALTARLASTREKMAQAASEEQDHLLWCQERIEELNTHTSYLNPLWYIGSFSIGAIAGAVGDKWSLGFVAETEHQVVAHLQQHLTKLAPQDTKSREILQQMAKDEQQHANAAVAAGAADLPQPIKKIMALAAKVMTTTAYYV